MTVVYILQLAPYQTGGLYHELAGLAFMALFVLHHMLNAGWLRRSRRSRRASAHINAVFDLLLAACVIGIMVSGILMSKDAVPALSRPSLAHVVRPLHACLTYAGLILISLHVGMHVPVLRGYLHLRNRQSIAGYAGQPRAARPPLVVVASFVAGAWAFLRLDVWTKLTMGMTFPDGMTSLTVLVLWHVALAAPCVVCGALLDNVTKQR